MHNFREMNTAVMDSDDENDIPPLSNRPSILTRLPSKIGQVDLDSDDDLSVGCHESDEEPQKVEKPKKGGIVPPPRIRSPNNKTFTKTKNKADMFSRSQTAWVEKINTQKLRINDSIKNKNNATLDDKQSKENEKSNKIKTLKSFQEPTQQSSVVQTRPSQSFVKNNDMSQNEESKSDVADFENVWGGEDSLERTPRSKKIHESVIDISSKPIESHKGMSPPVYTETSPK